MTLYNFMEKETIDFALTLVRDRYELDGLYSLSELKLVVVKSVVVKKKLRREPHFFFLKR